MNASKQSGGQNSQPDPYIFVSYSHTIRKEAEQVIHTLQANGYRVWFDNRLIPGGSYNDVIAGEIKRCQVFLCLLSEGYYDSSYCKQELLYAIEEKNKPIIPVYVGQIHEIKASLPEGIKFWLTGVHAIVLTNDENEFIKSIEMSGVVSSCKESIHQEDKNTTDQNEGLETASNDSFIEFKNNDDHQQSTAISKPSVFRRSAVTAVVEVLVLIFATIMMSKLMQTRPALQERIDGNVFLPMLLIMGTAIVIANIVDVLNKKEWLSFILTNIVFILGFLAFEHLGNVPASVPFLILIGEGFALLHMVISRFFGSALGKNISYSDETIIDDPDSEDEN